MGFPAGADAQGGRLAERIASGPHGAERALVRRALEGDVRAFRNLYDSCFRLAWGCSLRMTGDPGLAERLTAQALREAFAALGDFDGSESLGRCVLARLETARRELDALAAPPVDARAEQRDGA